MYKKKRGRQLSDDKNVYFSVTIDSDGLTDDLNDNADLLDLENWREDSLTQGLLTWILWNNITIKKETRGG